MYIMNPKNAKKGNNIIKVVSFFLFCFLYLINITMYAISKYRQISNTKLEFMNNVFDYIKSFFCKYSYKNKSLFKF